MVKLTLEIHDDVITTLNKLRDLNDTGIELEIPEGSVLFENILNLKLLKKETEKMGKVLHLETFDEVGQQLISMLNEEAGIEDETVPSIIPPIETSIRTRPTPPKFRMPSLNLSALNVGGSKKKIALLIAAVLILVVAGSFVTKAPKAYAKVIVTNMPLTKSLTIKAIKGTTSSAENKNIRATTLSADITDTLSIPTTGTKIIGEKAKGSVKIFNKTTSEREFKKGAVLIYKNNDTELKYITTETVVVPARTDTEPEPTCTLECTTTSTSGEKVVKAEAFEVGEKYNIDSGKAMTLEGRKSSEFVAESSTKMEGGESSTVKAVAEADKTKVSEDLLKTLKDKGESSLKSKLGNEQKLIEGSVIVTPGVQNFNHQVGDEAETLELTQTVTVQGLTYFQNDVERLIVQMADGFVPEGYVLSDKEKEITVQALGKTDTSVLTDTEADLQVTLKTYVVPGINEEELKNSLAGKNLEEAQRILGGINNIKTYELQINPNIPFLRKVPKDLNKIFITIERE